MLIGAEIRITKAEYKRALTSPDVLKERSVELLRVLHDAPNCEATSRQLAETLGYSDFPPANALVGKLGKRIAVSLSISLPEREDNSPGWWKIVAQGEQRPQGFTWRLRRELIDAMVELGLVSDNERRLYPELAQPTEELSEGKLRKVVVNSFERNAVARKLCIDHYQPECSVCNLNFQEKYGSIGKGFIHVHHLLELSTIGQEYKVNPVKDLRPVCPNCHAMLHQRSPAFSIEELRIIMKESSSLSPKII
jgi:5-methylcytosine-specific restriction protein A